MYTSETKLTVRYVETDKMGIVHHSNYYPWFELARGDFIKKIGMKYSEMESLGIMMPLVESYCKYYEGAKYEDEIIIETSIEKITPVKVIFNYDVIRELDGKLLAKGKTTQTFIDKDFKIVNLKKKYSDLWEKMQQLK
ncbi:4-hydroxybenzoyl-CoA thioesterase [Clostridium carboxidivorans P7]|uniref:Thioesterase superfamily protein n=1 Tax=Clostridium carboxidivorans P7 TaxID=536227 RepID=C6PVP3_9CLOT|nr:thioesterase family protein [Clostridium carboxidivorans]AKN30651.1 4-hydroxybenzoyl-CoA thioesterase [Clostridium carboxidivorans P7]EET86667.1 thioesterase superfamily protein [Clostridium carboxidivorans P7]EFG86408.1 acyl-CoA thioester hydrolase, YbgC/YbaW family [Clostridium carboxidivorans P7]